MIASVGEFRTAWVIQNHGKHHRLDYGCLDEGILKPETFQHMATEVRDLARVSAPHLPDRMGSFAVIARWLDECFMTLSPQGRITSEHLERANGRLQFVGKSLLDAFLATRNMTSHLRHDVLASLSSGLEATMPLAIRVALGPLLKQSHFPSAEAVRQAELMVDVAMMMTNRELRPFDGASVYLWWDSTPHGGHDWLLSQIHYVQRDLLANLLDAVHQVVPGRNFVIDCIGRALGEVQ
jgi:hypothetical protein